MSRQEIHDTGPFHAAHARQPTVPQLVGESMPMFPSTGGTSLSPLSPVTYGASARDPSIASSSTNPNASPEGSPTASRSPNSRKNIIDFDQEEDEGIIALERTLSSARASGRAKRAQSLGSIPSSNNSRPSVGYPEVLKFLGTPECQPDFKDAKLRKIGHVRKNRVGVRDVSVVPGDEDRESNMERSQTTLSRSARMGRTRFGRIRISIGRAVNSVMCQAVVLILIVFDVVLTVLEFNMSSEEKEDIADSKWYFNAVVLFLLGAEVVGRLIFLALPFFKSPLNVFELMLIPIGIAELTYFTNANASLMRALRPLFRGLRIVRILVKTAGRGSAFWRTIRRRVTGNRIRFEEDGFDLDLAYVDCGRIVVTSLPAVGVEALFRNPMLELARFLNERHTNKYLLINLTEEQRYSVQPFFGRYIQVPIAQNSVPSLRQMWDCCKLLRDFLSMDPEHVVCFHSKYGRGRVSVLAAAWLLFKGAFTSGSAALAHFEHCRFSELEELGFDQGTAQSVDTSSQLRFTEYFAELMKHRHKHGDERVEDLVRQPRSAKLKQVKIHGFVGQPLRTAHVRCFYHPKAAEKSAIRTASGSVLALSSSTAVSYKGTKTRSTSDVGPRITGATLRSSISSLFAMEEEASTNEKSTSEPPRSTMQLVKQEIDRARGEALAAGAHPQEGLPVLDTDPDTLASDCTPISESRSEPGQGQDINFLLKDSEACRGEVCFEVYYSAPDSLHVHRRRAASMLRFFTSFFCCWRRRESGMGSDEAIERTNFRRQMMFCFWLHSNFLGQSGKEAYNNVFASMQEEGGTSLMLVSLKRFDLDKAAGAPNLWSYSVSLEIGLEYEVELTARDVDSNKGSDSEDEDIALSDMMGLETMPAVKLGWVNWMIRTIWPFAEPAALKLLKDVLEPMLDKAMPAALKPVRVKQFKFGKGYPLVGPMTGCRRDFDGVELQLNCFVNYDSGLNVLLDIGNMAEVGISHCKVDGIVSVRLTPFIEEIPVVGGFQVFFLNPPDIQLTFAGHLELANISMIRASIMKVVQDVLLQKAVLPNMVRIDITKQALKRGDPFIQFGDCAPCAMMRLTVGKATKLRAADWHFFSEGSSDPYCVVQLGSTKKRTSVCKRTVNPEWNECFDLYIHDWHQQLFIYIYDDDFGKSDDMLGRVTGLPIIKVVEALQEGIWVPLDGDVIEDRTKIKRNRGSTGTELGSQLFLSAEVLHLKSDRHTLRLLTKLLKEHSKAGTHLQAQTTSSSDTGASWLCQSMPETCGPCSENATGDGEAQMADVSSKPVGSKEWEQSSATDEQEVHSVSFRSATATPTERKSAHSVGTLNTSGIHLKHSGSMMSLASTETTVLTESHDDAPKGGLFVIRIMGAMVPQGVTTNAADVKIQVSMGKASLLEPMRLSAKEYSGIDKVPGEVKEIIEGLAKSRLSTHEIVAAVNVDEIVVQRLVSKALGYNAECSKQRTYLRVSADDILESKMKLSLKVLVRDREVATTYITMARFTEKPQLHLRDQIKLTGNVNHVISLDIDASLLIPKKFSDEEVHRLVAKLR